MRNSIKKFIKDEDGLTMVEYAIAGSLVGLACVLAFTNLGNAIGAAIQRIIDVLTP
jgi:pilus assembly protein Flp/PilA